MQLQFRRKSEFAELSIIPAASCICLFNETKVQKVKLYMIHRFVSTQPEELSVRGNTYNL